MLKKKKDYTLKNKVLCGKNHRWREEPFLPLKNSLKQIKAKEIFFKKTHKNNFMDVNFSF